MDMSSDNRVCYVHCNFCNTILVVSVPSSSMLMSIVTVRCGHCAFLLSLNIASPHFPLHQDILFQKQNLDTEEGNNLLFGSSSSPNSINFDESPDRNNEQPRPPPIRPPEKRRRVPSAYNKFIKEEIQRIKADNPEISHREAFSSAAKNWSHFPHIRFELKLDENNGDKQTKNTLEQEKMS